MTVLRAACDLLFAFAGDKEAFMGTGRERKGKFPSGGWCTGLFPTSKEEGSRRKSFCWFLVIPESFSCWARNLSALWLLLPFSYPHCLPIRPPAPTPALRQSLLALKRLQKPSPGGRWSLAEAASPPGGPWAPGRLLFCGASGSRGCAAKRCLQWDRGPDVFLSTSETFLGSFRKDFWLSRNLHVICFSG